MTSINPIGPVGQPDKNQKPSGPQKTEGSSFKNTLQGFLSDVNQMQAKADESIKKMAAGEITDVHQVMSTVQEASVSFNMMMEIRNKVMEAYQEVLRMRI